MSGWMEVQVFWSRIDYKADTGSIIAQMWMKTYHGNKGSERKLGRSPNMMVERPVYAVVSSVVNSRGGSSNSIF